MPSTPSLAALYRALNHAVDEAWIEIDPDGATDAELASRGRPPQVYRITAAGVSAVEEEAERMRTLADLALADAGQGRREA